MQTVYFDNQSIKEIILSDMITFVKVFSVTVVVLSIVLVTIQVCETAKRDFKLRNIFGFMDDKKVNKKTKKDIRHLKDFKIHYIEGKGGKDGKNHEMLIPQESQQSYMHTLMPLPLPVHLPIPAHPHDHLVGSQPLPPPPPQAFPLIHPEHLSFHQNTHFHNPHLPHFHQPQLHSHQMTEPNRLLLTETSSPMIRPLPPPIIITQEFNPMPAPVHLPGHIEERISFPVYELLSDDSIETIRNTVHPNAHSYGDNEDSIRTNLEINRRNNHKNHMNDNKQRISKDNQQTTVRLVNNKKFNTIHNFNSDQFFNEESSHSRQVIKSNENSRNSDRRQSPNQRNRNQENQLKPLDNRIDEKVYSEPIPDEQVINIVEDEWTFKDLDLWIIR